MKYKYRIQIRREVMTHTLLFASEMCNNDFKVESHDEYFIIRCNRYLLQRIKECKIPYLLLCDDITLN